jgi:hypothetical protein
VLAVLLVAAMALVLSGALRMAWAAGADARSTLVASDALIRVDRFLGADVARAESMSVSQGTLTLSWTAPDGDAVQAVYALSGTTLTRTLTDTPPSGPATTTTDPVAFPVDGLSFSEPSADEVTVSVRLGDVTETETFSERGAL